MALPKNDRMSPFTTRVALVASSAKKAVSSSEPDADAVAVAAVAPSVAFFAPSSAAPTTETLRAMDRHNAMSTESFSSLSTR